jgi:hypothetical protein
MNILFTYIKAIVLACLLISGASAANAAEHDLSAEEATKLFSGKTVKAYYWIVGQEFCNIIVSDGKEYREIMTRKGGAEHIATFVKFTEGNPDNL